MLLYVCVSIYVYMCGGCACTIAHLWKSKDNFHKSVFPLYHVDSMNPTQVITLDSTPLYLLRATPLLDSYGGFQK